ncbi:hypothetical protein VNO78_08607 [Psophocarpus tetragonolobus]|uniref:Uncharacterized protein n=1 Tax=Psophocarpus tetragonolobus TaxID=3891 RepID=A0AAN9SY96_PSOTE
MLRSNNKKTLGKRKKEKGKRKKEKGNGYGYGYVCNAISFFLVSYALEMLPVEIPYSGKLRKPTQQQLRAHASCNFDQKLKT